MSLPAREAPALQAAGLRHRRVEPLRPLSSWKKRAPPSRQGRAARGKRFRVQLTQIRQPVHHRHRAGARPGARLHPPHPWPLGVDHRVDDAVLIVNELATNAVLHAAPHSATGQNGVRLDLTLRRAHLVCAVANRREPARLPTHGRPAGSPWPWPAHRRRTVRALGLDSLACGQDRLGDAAHSPVSADITALAGSDMTAAASAEPPGARHHATPLVGADIETTLKNLRDVPWRDLQDSTGSATGIPFLLAAITTGDEATAVAALARLRQRICQYGFVVDRPPPPRSPSCGNWSSSLKSPAVCRSFSC